MWPIVTNRVEWSVCLSVCLSVCHTSERCKNGWTDRDSVCVMDLSEPKEACIRWSPDPACEGAIIRGKGMPGRACACRTIFFRELCKNNWTDRSDLPSGLWTRIGGRKQKFNRIRQVAPTFPCGKAHWCHLANTIELPVCGGDAALCQITMTTLVRNVWTKVRKQAGLRKAVFNKVNELLSRQMAHFVLRSLSEMALYLKITTEALSRPTWGPNSMLVSSNLQYFHLSAVLYESKVNTHVHNKTAALKCAKLCNFVSVSHLAWFLFAKIRVVDVCQVAPLWHFEAYIWQKNRLNGCVQNETPLKLAKTLQIGSHHLKWNGVAPFCLTVAALFN